MISYNCGKCKARLETEEALGGQEERCPSCGATNRVPARAPTRQALAELARSQPAPAKRPKFRPPPPPRARPAKANRGPAFPGEPVVTVFRAFGWLCLLLGGVGIALAVVGATRASTAAESRDCIGLLVGGFLTVLCSVFPFGLAFLLTHTGRTMVAVEKLAAGGRQSEEVPLPETPVALEELLQSHAPGGE